MMDKSFWIERGYSENSAKTFLKGIRAFMREVGLREEDLEGLMLLLRLRNDLRPDLSLKEFLQALLSTLMQRQGIVLSEKAIKGYRKFYDSEEDIEKAINRFGEILADMIVVEKIDPLDEIAVQLILENYQKLDMVFPVSVNRKLLEEYRKLVSEEDAKAISFELKNAVERIIKREVSKIKEKKLRAKLRAV